MVRQPSPREATFSKNGGTPKMSDLKAPTYEIPSLVGWAFMVRQLSFREATFKKNVSTPKMSYIKAQTSKSPGAVADTSKIVLSAWFESERLFGSLLPFDAGQIHKSPGG
jgi:hypothetical protein